MHRIAAAALVAWSLTAGAQSADLVLTNGHIVTVDEQFRIVQALAIRGERIVAAGASRDIDSLKGPNTRLIDLRGRTVIPGLIDNHAHYMRAAEYWDREVRLDGVTSHKRALELIARKARESQPGEWVVVLGGWTEDQFVDEPRGFTRAELDAAARANPVALQLLYARVYANSAALKALGHEESDGTLSGPAAVRALFAQLGEVGREKRAQNARLLMHDLNRVGITAFQDEGGMGAKPEHVQAFRDVHDAGQMTLRAFYNQWEQPRSAAEVDAVIANIGELKPFQGDDWLDLTGYGETVYFPLHDNLLAKTAAISPEGMALWRKLGLALARQGVHLNVHAQLAPSIKAFLDAIEAINREKPIRGLRWTFSHLDQVDADDLARMRRLDVYAQLHSRPTIQGALMKKVHGEEALHMPPLRLVQESGVPWGLGSDATAVAPANPFYTLGWAVTGKALSGTMVNTQTITREQALIAHTRSNAAFLFQEANLGALAPGKYADLLVLDRDYLKVPADAIKDIRPLMTMVGGRIVYEAPNTP
jgi:predicted amidohydrolase YtcJ